MSTARVVRNDAGHEVLEREFEMIEGAILMVASGAATRVCVANMQFGGDLVSAARDMARQAGVSVTPIWRADEAGADIVVEHLDAR